MGASASWQTVDVNGEQPSVSDDDGVVFWDYAKGEETSNPRFEVPDYIPYVKGEKYLYSSDGNWFSGVEVLDSLGMRSGFPL